nr:syntaxin-52-like isoform X3 [Tanacetum cinerariifolium]
MRAKRINVKTDGIMQKQQDEGLGKSEETVISTKHIALAVNEDLTLHTRLIDDLDEHVDVTDSRLKVTLSLINLEERVRLLGGSPKASTTPIYSRGLSTPPSYSSGLSSNVECSNCKFLVGKIVLEATLEMYMHPENHTLDSIALLHVLYNDMGKIGLE